MGIEEFTDQIFCMDALDLLRRLPDGSVDAVITDPPYPEIDRDYGRLSEAEWMNLMKPVLLECKRVVKPEGSAVFILQPNFEKLGSLRLWFPRFQVYAGEVWNIVQDIYWWNFTPLPGAGVSDGLLRQSIKPIIWLGRPNCYRNQSEVLWTLSDRGFAMKKESYALRYYPSGNSTRRRKMAETAIARGGSTPMNLIPIANADSQGSAGANGHGAGTPAKLIEWLIKYLSPPKSIILDPFMGSGTTALVARSLDKHYIGCDLSAEYVEMARRRLANSDPYEHTTLENGDIQLSLFERKDDETK